jgi:hypothetical protein
MTPCDCQPCRELRALREDWPDLEETVLESQHRLTAAAQEAGQRIGEAVRLAVFRITHRITRGGSE